MSSDEKESTLTSFVLDYSDELLSDISFLKMACRKKPEIIKFASTSILQNYESVYEILESLSFEIETLSSNKKIEIINKEIDFIKKEIEILDKSIQEEIYKCKISEYDKLSYERYSLDKREIKIFCQSLPEEVYNYPKILIELCKHDDAALEKASYNTRNNFNIVREIVSNKDSCVNFCYASHALQTNLILLKMYALNINGKDDEFLFEVFNKVNEIDKNSFDKEFALKMCAKHGWFTKYLNKSLQNDHDVLRTCLASQYFSYWDENDDYDISCMTYCSPDNTLLRDKNFVKKCLERDIEQIKYFKHLEFIDYSFTFNIYFDHADDMIHDKMPYNIHEYFSYLPIKLQEEENFLLVYQCTKVICKVLEYLKYPMFSKCPKLDLIDHINEMNQNYKNFKLIYMAINRNFVRSTKKLIISFAGSKNIMTANYSCYLPMLDGDGYTGIRYLIAEYLGINLSDEIRLIDHIKIVRCFYRKFGELSNKIIDTRKYKKIEN